VASSNDIAGLIGPLARNALAGFLFFRRRNGTRF
jgi:hypothetical protein